MCLANAPCGTRARAWVLAVAFVAGALLAGARVARAQRPVHDSLPARADSAALDSLRARLARAEADIALLREEIGGESETTVHTRSRVRVEISALVLMNGFASDGRVNNEDDPQLALPPTAGAPTGGSLGATLRQTRLGLATSISGVLGGLFQADMDADLYGGVQSGPGDRRLFPEPRLRTARARLSWTRTQLSFGADAPLISELDPVSLAGVGVPDFSGAGDLWNWLPQVRVTQALGGDTATTRLRWALQAAVMSPYAAQTGLGEPDAIDAGDRSRRPALEARLRARWGEDPDGTISDGLIARSGGEIGIGMHRGWIAMEPGEMLESHAVSIDAHAVVAPGVEIRGEAYTGRLLRGLGGGGIAQNFGVATSSYSTGTVTDSLGPPLRDAAGWAQVNLQPHPLLLGSIGCGVDLANAHDAPVRRQNTVCAVGLSWRPAQPLLLGVEYRRIGTRYTTGTFGAQHFNFALGFEL